MPDMLVKLYGLPPSASEVAALAAERVVCRRAESYERAAVIEFVKRRLCKRGTSRAVHNPRR